MLNGLYPVLLFYTVPTNKKGTKFLPPIPVYLDENLTKLALDGERENLDIVTESLADVKDGQVDIVQKGISQTVNIELVARQDDPVLGLLLPMLKSFAVNVITDLQYKVAYFHGDILIFNAKLAGFDKEPESGTNKIRLTITLEIKPETPKKDNKSTPLEYSNAEPNIIGTSGPTEGLSSMQPAKAALTPVNESAKTAAEATKQALRIEDLPPVIIREPKL